MHLTPTTDRELVGLLEAISSKLDALIGASDPVSEGGPDQMAPGDPAAWAAMLQRVLRRDGGRCGLCATVMDTSVAGQVLLDWIVPAHLPGFDVVKGQATPGRRYRSAGASVSNLQAVHAYCEDRQATGCTCGSGATRACLPSRSPKPRRERCWRCPPGPGPRRLNTNTPKGGAL